MCIAIENKREAIIHTVCAIKPTLKELLCRVTTEVTPTSRADVSPSGESAGLFAECRILCKPQVNLQVEATNRGGHGDAHLCDAKHKMWEMFQTTYGIYAK